MSIEKITSKIISDAEKEAQVTLDAAKAECDGILAEAKTKADEIVAKAEKEGKEDKEKLVSRRKAVAEIDGRKIALEEKQKVIAECFEKAVDKIASMEKGEYISFLAGLAKATGQTEGELIMNEKDAAEIGKDLVEAIAKEVEDSKITLSEETKNIRGGFLLKNGAVYVNNTIEALIEEAKADLISEVAAQLFQ